MDKIEETVLDTFKGLLLKRGNLYKLILFGSRARGDADPYSDMDIVVVLNDSANEEDFDYVSDSAWGAGFNHGIVIVPVVFTRSQWQNSPERYSLLAQAAETEGVSL